MVIKTYFTVYYSKYNGIQVVVVSEILLRCASAVVVAVVVVIRK